MFSVKIENKFLYENFEKYLELNVHMVQYNFENGEFVKNEIIPME